MKVLGWVGGIEKGLGRGNSKCKEPQAAESVVCSWDGKAQRCCGRVIEFHKEGRSWVMQDLISHRKDIVFILKTMGNH